MTMVPSQSGKQNRITDYVIYSNTTSAMNQVEVEGYNCLGSEFVVRHMAEEEESSRANTSTTTNHNQPGSTSKEEEEERGNNNNNNSNWLQLSIGFHQSQSTATTTKHDRDHHRLVELELLPSGRHSNSRPNLEPPAIFPARGCQGGSSFGASLLFEQTTSSMSMSMPCGPSHQHREMMNWAFGPLLPHSMAFMPSSSFTPSSSSPSSHSCSSLRPSLGSVPFHFPSSSGFDQFDAAGPSSDVTVRVVDPPPRPHSGIWFMLQASQNQAKEPFLPQIPKNYLRIKDGRMTVRLLLKYLVSKLKLENESEIEITCRGQQLLPFLTLQHVRDNIWTTRDTSTRALLADSSTTDHVMVLHYGRSTA